MQPSRAMLFDFDHTLGIDNRLEERVLRGLAVRYCKLVPTDADIAAALHDFRSGQFALDTMIAEAVSAWGGIATPAIAHEYRAVAIALVPSSVEPMPGAGELFEFLTSRGIRNAILSNGWRDLQAAKAAAIGYSGRVITSEEIGAWKPDARAFICAASIAAVDPAQTLYVGDSPVADVEGSKNAGMRAVWADLEGRDYPAGVAGPDYVIKRLTDLFALIT